MSLHHDNLGYHIRATYESHQAMDTHRSRPVYLNTIRRIEEEGLGLFNIRETRLWPVVTFTRHAKRRVSEVGARGTT